MKSNKQVALEIKKDGSVYIQPDNIFVENQMEGHYIVARHHPEKAVNSTILCNPGIYPIEGLTWEVKEELYIDNAFRSRKVAILKESTPSEPKIPLNYAQRAVRDETGKVIRFEPFDKARLKEALKEVKAKNKEIRDSYQADNETMSFRAAKESTPSTEQENQEDKLIKLINMYWTFDDNQRHTHTWHDKQDCIEQIRTHFTITRNLKEKK